MDDSYCKGYFVNDLVSFSEKDDESRINYTIGCHTNISSRFADRTGNGIFGLAYSGNNYCVIS